MVLILLSIVVVGLSINHYLNNFATFFQQILVEAHGMLFDVAIIGILIFWLNKIGEQRLRIKTYQDEIDDFRLWESDEAAFRTVGNIKRLNQHKIYDINLVNCYLSKTNLSHVVLSGSNINSCNLSHANLVGANLEGARLNQTNLENAQCNKVNFKNSYASGANFRDAVLIKTNFENAFLIKADFQNAFLMEADLRGCHLTGAHFKNANLYKADLREVEGLNLKSLCKAKTLYLAKFDKEVTEKLKAMHPELLGKEAFSFN
ncbi:MAG: pentapeptide repeat-containing protein [Cyclobacteriaceae bacterium]